jgi:glutamyl/glutaminyl-tRNA synthetase
MLRLTSLPPRPLTRLAPSPTGSLHLGHLLHLIWLLGLTRATGGRLLLRLEDHDRARCRPAYEREIIGTLTRLGIKWEAGFVSSSPDPYRQSDVPERYHAALDTLRAQGRLYACDCSRAQVRARAQAAGHEVDAGDELAYDGYCRDRHLPESPHVGLRVRLDDSTVRFDDVILGPQVQPPGGDLLLRDRTGQFTYHLCVVADDLVHEIDWVVRGVDILPTTGRQLQLRQLLGGETPLIFAHHPLITDDSGRKLSKAEGAASVAAALDRGERPEDLFGQAAFRGGLIAQPRAVAVSEFDGLVAHALHPSLGG